MSTRKIDLQKIQILR